MGRNDRAAAAKDLHLMAANKLDFRAEVQRLHPHWAMSCADF
jgi:hypothetical protein